MALQDDERRRLRERFDAYQETGDLAIRDELAAAHLRLAIHLARRFTNRGVPQDDLEQVAALGLLKAIDRFEPERGLEFSTFATPTIVGELKRHFRDKGWAVRVPRRVQELHVRLNAVVGELTHQLGRSPTIAELAKATRASQEEVLEAMEAAQAYRSGSIDTGTGPDDDVNVPQLGAEDQELFAAENRVFLEDLIDRLPSRDQLLLRLRYYEEMTQSEIAERLGISQMHVSRLLGRTLADLRNRIETGNGPTRG
jgi:RNA polymerase sigma-B factor